MGSNMKNKLIASVILSAFIFTNSTIATMAADNYYGDYAQQLRSYNSVEQSDITTEKTIKNGDSIVNLSLRDADVTQVLRMFADQAGMNVIFADGVSGTGDNAKTVTMDLVDIPLKDALDLVMKTKGLFYDIQANTLVVSTKDDSLVVSDRTKDITIVPVKYVNALALSKFLNESIFNPKGSSGSINPNITHGYIVATNPATNELIVNGTENDLKIVRKIVEQFDKKPSLTTIKVNHTTPAEMANSICTSLVPTMFVANGGESGGAAGIATGFASDTSSSSGTSSGISVNGGTLACSMSTQQETEEQSGDGDTSNNLSSLNLVNFSVSYFPTLGTIQILGGSDYQIQMIKDYIAENDKKTPQAYIEMQIVSLSESGSKEFDNTWKFLSKNFSFNADGGIKTDAMYPVFFAGKGYKTYKTTDDYPWDVNGKYGKYSGSPQLVYTVNYLISSSKGRVLASPKILATNGQKSVIDLTSDYVSKITTEYLDSTVGTSSQVQKSVEVANDNGIKVEVTPFISPDGYVTLDLTPQYATISEKIYDKGETDQKDLLATLLQRRNLELKGVRIKDGETLVIGGLISETEAKSVSKIPFLGDIPVVGMFFRSTTTERAKEEMVILITPRIVVDTEDAVAEDTNL